MPTADAVHEAVRNTVANLLGPLGPGAFLREVLALVAGGAYPGWPAAPIVPFAEGTAAAERLRVALWAAATYPAAILRRIEPAGALGSGRWRLTVASPHRRIYVHLVASPGADPRRWASRSRTEGIAPGSSRRR